MAFVINCLESQGKGRLHSQPEVNPKNISAMTLKSGKEIEGPNLTISKDKSEDQIEKELEEEGLSKIAPEVVSNLLIKINTYSPPFLNKLEKPKRQDKEKEILEVF